MTGHDGRTVADAVRSQFPSQDIDAFIVVTKGSSSIGDSNFFVSGLGIFEADIVLIHTSDVYAIYWITVVDGRRFTVIGNTLAWSVGQSLSAMSAVHGPIGRWTSRCGRPRAMRAPIRSSAMSSSTCCSRIFPARCRA
jgi:hypothetical protein